MVQSKIDTSEVSKSPRTNRETVAPRQKSLRDPKIALSDRVNEGERKLGTRRDELMDEKRKSRGKNTKRDGKEREGGKRKERKEKRRRLRRRVRAHTRVKPKRGPVPTFPGTSLVYSLLSPVSSWLSLSSPLWFSILFVLILLPHRP